ncbi:MAG TPA: DUF4097 family beta strand repeat-containing protein [Gemmatimonadaceae bacterium]|nr:DUF4097 family beta strand repeat-containing protein [Gemmatimonadaceae bacterium]
MRRPVISTLSLTVAFVVCAGTTIAAQADRSSRFLDNCRQNRGDNEQFCETRNFTMPASKALTVDGRENGGITVHAWDRAEIQVVAMVQTQAESQADAGAIAKNIAIAVNNGEIRANGPSLRGRHESWSVSFEVWAPRNTDLALTASNGGISVDGIESRMNLETVNGGLNLVDVNGDVRGTTTNGGVTAELSGDGWRGGGLDLRTTNGGVHLTLPSNYSASLETGTVNGRMDIGFPVTVQGSIDRRLTTRLGNGGQMIRATTTNGGVSIRRR